LISMTTPDKYHFSPQPWTADEFGSRLSLQHWLIALGNLLLFILWVLVLFLFTGSIHWGFSCIISLTLMIAVFLLEAINDRICSTCKRWNTGQVVWSDSVTDGQGGLYYRAVYKCKVCGHEW